MQASVPQGWGERVSKLYSPSTWSAIKALGEAAGFEFKYDAPLSDTMDSHRLNLLAEQQGKQREVVHEISRRYFVEGTPLNDRQSLLEVADLHGIEGAAAYLDSDAGKREVLESVRSMQASGIRSIPVARISSGNYSNVIHGSASPDEFHSVFQEIERHWTSC